MEEGQRRRKHKLAKYNSNRSKEKPRKETTNTNSLNINAYTAMVKLMEINKVDRKQRINKIEHK